MGRQGSLGADDRRDHAERAVRGVHGGGAADYGAGAGDEGAGGGEGGVGAGDGDGGGCEWECVVEWVGERGRRGVERVGCEGTQGGRGGRGKGVRYLCSESDCIQLA